MKNAVVYAATLAVTVTVVNVIIYQMRKGEPRLMQSIVSGVAVGIGVAAFQYWKSSNKTNADHSSSQ